VGEVSPKATRVLNSEYGMKGFDVTILPGSYEAELCHQGRKCVRHCKNAKHEPHQAVYYGDCHPRACWPRDP